MAERSREATLTLSKLDARGRVPAEPRAAALQQSADCELAITGMHDADELRRLRHAATADAGAKRRC